MHACGELYIALDEVLYMYGYILYVILYCTVVRVMEMNIIFKLRKAHSLRFRIQFL